MPQVFYRKKFSDYLGEQRAIDDIVTFFTASIPPSPTGTPNPTPTPTSTPSVFYSGLFFTGNTNVDACSQINPSVTLYSTSPFYTYYQQVFTQPTNNSAYWIPFGLFLASGSTSYEYQYIGFAPGLVDLGACPSPTPTPTNTVTPTLTKTPSPTPTSPPICGEQITISNATNPEFDGTYDRVHSYTGGTFVGGWVGSNDIFTPGVSPDSNLYSTWVRTVGSTAYTISNYYYLGPFPVSYQFGFFKTIGSLVDNQDTGIIGGAMVGFTGYTNIGGVLYLNPVVSDASFGGTSMYVSYPPICPTPTPTSTTTLTPTLTPTPTATPAPGFDVDAANYLNAIILTGGTLSPTISAATDTLFVSLKSNGLYSKIKAFYPVLGGIAASQAINGNLNTSYNLTFNNGFTHSYSGFVGTTLTSYAETNYVPSTEHTGNTMSMGMFTNDVDLINTEGNFYMMGAYVAQDRFLSWDYENFSSNPSFTGKYLQNTSTTSIPVSATTNWIGMVQLGGDGTTKYITQNRNGVNYIASAAQDGTTLPNQSIYLSNINVLGGPYRGQGSRVAFAYMGDYLTTGETTTLSSIINTFQTTLGRNTY